MRSYKGPIFAHRHYAALAKVLADAREEITLKEPDESQGDLLDGVSYVQDFMREVFQRDNSRFQRDRFEAAARGMPSNGRDKR